MTPKKRGITRRDFIRSGSYLAAGSLMGLPMLSDAAQKRPEKSRVILIRDEHVVSGGAISSSRLDAMLDQAVVALLDAGDPSAAWKQLVHPDDTVGIKSNVWAPLPTPASLEKALIKRLLDAGISKKRIAADDRGVRSNPIFKKSTVLINVRPMRTHHWSGLGTLLKNYIMFVGQPWRYHGNACQKLGVIWQKSSLRDKTRLNILVMLTPLFHGIGPHHFSRRYLWAYNGLIVSRDPVAADATGARIIQAKRNEYFGQTRPISPPPRHIEAADIQYGLGHSHPDRIQIIQLGWKKDILI